MITQKKLNYTVQNEIWKLFELLLSGLDHLWKLNFEGSPEKKRNSQLSHFYALLLKLQDKIKKTYSHVVQIGLKLQKTSRKKS